MRLLQFAALAFLSAWSLIQMVQAAPAAYVDFFRHSAKITHMPTGQNDHSAIQLTDSANKVWKCDESIRARLLGSDYKVGDEVTFVQKLQTSADTAYNVHKVWNVGTVMFVNRAKSLVALEDSRSKEQIYCENAKSVIALMIQPGVRVGFRRKGTAAGKDVAYNVVKVGVVKQ